jgi:hypothetical protein
MIYNFAYPKKSQKHQKQEKTNTTLGPAHISAFRIFPVARTLRQNSLISLRQFQDTKTIATIIKKSPMPEINVNVSFSRIEETAKATITSVKRMIVELTGEMCFKASDHK